MQSHAISQVCTSLIKAGNVREAATIKCMQLMGQGSPALILRDDGRGAGDRVLIQKLVGSSLLGCDMLANVIANGTTYRCNV